MSHRALSPQEFKFSSEEFVGDIEAHGGASRSERTGQAPATGYMASHYGSEMSSAGAPPAEAVTKFRQQNAAQLGQSENYLGGWKDKDVVYTDVSKRFDRAGEAHEFARRNAQLATFNTQSYNDPAVQYGSRLPRAGRNPEQQKAAIGRKNEAERQTVVAHLEARAGRATGADVGEEVWRAQQERARLGGSSISDLAEKVRVQRKQKRLERGA